MLRTSTRRIYTLSEEVARYRVEESTKKTALQEQLDPVMRKTLQKFSRIYTWPKTLRKTPGSYWSHEINGSRNYMIMRKKYTLMDPLDIIIQFLRECSLHQSLFVNRSTPKVVFLTILDNKLSFMTKHRTSHSNWNKVWM